MAAWFEPLLAALADQPAATTTVTLTLAELEALASRPVPTSAATQGYWHSNLPYSPRRRLAAIGWRAGHVDRMAATITFIRIAAGPP